eukprot:960030_1
MTVDALSELKRALHKAHTEGRALLEANNGKLLLQHRTRLKHELCKEGLDGMEHKRMRYYAKRLGISNCLALSQHEIKKQLESLVPTTVRQRTRQRKSKKRKRAVESRTPQKTRQPKPQKKKKERKITRMKTSHE